MLKCHYSSASLLGMLARNWISCLQLCAESSSVSFGCCACRWQMVNLEMSVLWRSRSEITLPRDLNRHAFSWLSRQLEQPLQAARGNPYLTSVKIHIYSCTSLPLIDDSPMARHPNWKNVWSCEGLWRGLRLLRLGIKYSESHTFWSILDIDYSGMNLI